MFGMARPQALTDERRDAIERALAAGAPLSVAAAAGDVSARSVSRWLGEGRVVRRTLSAVPEPDLSGGELVEDEQLQRALVASVLRASQHDWRAATWLLEKRWPQRYARR
jgi:hypothetical protein